MRNDITKEKKKSSRFIIIVNNTYLIDEGNYSKINLLVQSSERILCEVV